MTGHAANPLPSAPMQRSVGGGRLSCAVRDGKTVLADLYQHANAKIRLPATHSDHMEAVLVNTAGGLTGGDRLTWDFDIAANASLTVTTQACERIYKASSDTAKISTRIKIGDNATCLWVPQETILFDQSSLTRDLHIDLAPSASATLLETYVFGRQAMNEAVSSVYLRDQWHVRRAGHLIHREALALDDYRAAHAALSSLAGHHVAATLVHIPAEAQQALIEAKLVDFKNTLADHAGALPHCAVSAFADKIVIRALAPDTYSLRPLLSALVRLCSPNEATPACWNS